jgi:hypothetical protein
MKVRICARLATAIIAGLVATGSSTWAAGIPREARNAQTDASLTAFKPAIKAEIDQKLALLLGADATARSNVRETFVQDVPRDASTIYLKYYCDELNKAAIPALAKADAAAKLNLAIVIAKVAERAENTSLAEATRVLLNDPSEANVIWGLKAAQSIVPVLASHPLDPNVGLIGDVETTAEKRQSGWVIDDAYIALTMSRADRPTPDMVEAVFPSVQKLLTHRLGIYATRVPPLPIADSRATAFLVSSAVWETLNDQQRLWSVQMLTDLLNAATTQFSLKSDNRSDLAPLIKQVGKAFWVVGSLASSDVVKKASEAVSLLSQGSTPEAARQAVSALFADVVAVPAYKDLHIPTTTPANPSDAPGAAPGK